MINSHREPQTRIVSHTRTNIQSFRAIRRVNFNRKKSRESWKGECSQTIGRWFQLIFWEYIVRIIHFILLFKIMTIGLSGQVVGLTRLTSPVRSSPKEDWYVRLKSFQKDETAVQHLISSHYNQFLPFDSSMWFTEIYELYHASNDGVKMFQWFIESFQVVVLDFNIHLEWQTNQGHHYKICFHMNNKTEKMLVPSERMFYAVSMKCHGDYVSAFKSVPEINKFDNTATMCWPQPVSPKIWPSNWPNSQAIDCFSWKYTPNRLIPTALFARVSLREIVKRMEKIFDLVLLIFGKWENNPAKTRKMK